MKESLEKYHRKIIIISMFVILTIVALIDVPIKRYIIVEVYLTLLLLYLFWYIFKKNNITKKNLILLVGFFFSFPNILIFIFFKNY